MKCGLKSQAADGSLQYITFDGNFRRTQENTINLSRICMYVFKNIEDRLGDTKFIGFISAGCLRRK